MSEARRHLRAAAQFTKCCETARLEGGLTLGEALTLEGVSLWDVVAPVLAAFVFPKAFAREKPLPWFIRRLRPKVSWARRRLLGRLPSGRRESACSGWPAEPPVLFLGFSRYMFRDVLAPVVRVVADEHGLPCSVLCDGDPRGARDEGVQGTNASVWAHWNEEVEGENGRLQRRYRELRRVLSARSLKAAIEGIGACSWKRVEMTFAWLLDVYLPSLVPYLVVTRHVLLRHQIAVCVSSDVADPRTRLFCLAGRRVGVPTMEVQFGMYGEDSVEWGFFVADRVAVWGKAAEGVLMAHGVPSTRIVITGSPRFDKAHRNHHLKGQGMRARLGIPDGKKIVLFASQYSLHHYSEFGDYPRALMNAKRALFDAAKGMEGVVVVVKPHPLENARETQRLAGEARNVVFVDPSEDIRELIPECDVFVTLGSTATMDALIQRKVILFLAFPGLVWWDDMYLKSEATWVVTSERDLAACMEGAIGSEGETGLEVRERARQQFLADWVGQCDGRASQRVARIIAEMRLRGAAYPRVVGG